MTVHMLLLPESDHICLRKISPHNAQSDDKKIPVQFDVNIQTLFSKKKKKIVKTGRMLDSMSHYDAYKQYPIQYVE